jgi:hypothetical protein
MSIERHELLQEAFQELEIPTPRKVRLRSLGEAKGLWVRIDFVSLFFLATVLFIFYQNVLPVLAWKYGVPAKATVESLWITHGRGSGYHMRVSFSPKDQRVWGDINISQAVYGQLSMSGKVDIHYLPLFPGRPSLDLYPPPLFVFLFPLIFFLSVPVFTFFDLLKQRNLLIVGKAVTGSVSDMKGRGGSVEYFFQGKVHFARMGRIGYGGANEIGNAVVVVIDPDKPSRHIIYDPSICVWKPEKESF